jgi:hypothetical protein
MRHEQQGHVDVAHVGLHAAPVKDESSAEAEERQAHRGETEQRPPPLRRRERPRLLTEPGLPLQGALAERDVAALVVEELLGQWQERWPAVQCPIVVSEANAFAVCQGRLHQMRGQVRGPVTVGRAILAGPAPPRGETPASAGPRRSTR